MQPLLLVVAMFVVPVIGGVVLGFAQLGIYRLLAKVRGWPDERIPAFPILFARGMLAVVGGAIAMALLTRALSA